MTSLYNEPAELSDQILKASASLLLSWDGAAHVCVAVTNYRHCQLIIFISHSTAVPKVKADHTVPNTFVSLAPMWILPGPVGNTETAPLFIRFMSECMSLFHLFTRLFGFALRNCMSLHVLFEFGFNALCNN